MPPADMVCISMTSGNTSETPASASAPSQPTKTASSVRDRGLEHHDQDVGRGESQERRRDGPVEQEARARGHRRRGGGTRGGSAVDGDRGAGHRAGLGRRRGYRRTDARRRVAVGGTAAWCRGERSSALGMASLPAAAVAAHL